MIRSACDSASFLQPFLSFTTRAFSTYGINAESPYNWKTSQWSVPTNLTITPMLKFGARPFTIIRGRALLG